MGDDPVSASATPRDRAAIPRLVEPPTRDEALAAAACVIRHGRDQADIDDLMEMLGLDVPMGAFRCTRCAYPLGSLGHAVSCDAQRTRQRLDDIAKAIPARGPKVAPMLAFARPHPTKGRRGRA